MTSALPTQRRSTLPTSARARVRQLVVLVCRASTICVLTALVVLLGVSAFVTLAFLGVAKLARSRSASLRLGGLTLRQPAISDRPAAR